METIENAVGGKRYVSASTRRVPVYHPATGEQSAELPLSTSDELNAAVAKSRAEGELKALRDAIGKVPGFHGWLLRRAVKKLDGQ